MLLRDLDFEIEAVDVPPEHLIPLALVDRYWSMCMEEEAAPGDTPDEVPTCDVGRLVRMLVEDVRSGHIASVDPEGAMEEIGRIAEVALQHNQINLRRAARLHLLRAWEQLLNVALIKYHAALPDRERVITSLLADILAKIPPELQLKQDLEPDLLSVVSNIVVILMANLRQALLRRPEGDDLGYSLTLLRNELQQLLGGITQGVLFKRSDHNMRQNQHASLLFYLQVAHDARTAQEEALAAMGGGRARPSSTANRFDVEDLAAAAIHPLNDLSQRFMDAVCRDACDSADLTCVLALSALTELVAQDEDGRWLAFMQRYNYLSHYVEEVEAADDALLQYLQYTPPSDFLELYKFERRMALLLRVAYTQDGVTAVRDTKLLKKLGGCTFIGNRPVASSDSSYAAVLDAAGTSGAPSPLQRHRDLAMPVVRLLVAMLETTGCKNEDVFRDVLLFTQLHASKYFRVVLKDRHVHVSAAAMRELALVTALMRHLACPRFALLCQEILGYNMLRFQSQMLSLLTFFGVRDRWRGHIDYANCSQLDQLEIECCAQEVVFNVLGFLRQRMDSPSQTDEHSWEMGRARPLRPLFRASFQQSTEDAPALGVLLNYLKQAHETLKVCGMA